MSKILMPSSPIWGHIAPMLVVGEDLQRRGHEVVVLTGRKYEDAVRRHGLGFVPLPAGVDYDDADLDAWLPGRDRYKGLAAVRYDITGMFARTIPGQHRALTAELESGGYDLVLSEGVFMGALPTLLTVPRAERVPIISVSALPVTLTSEDTAPFGPALQPGSGPLARLRNRALNSVLHAGPLKPIQRAVVAALAEVGAPAPAGNFFDQPYRFDATFLLAAEGIEYPRRELPPTVRFLGPLRQAARRDAVLPSWWADVTGGRPVVHVTQGTIDNVDLGKLLVPALRALAAEDVLVVAATGGRPVAEVERAFPEGLPANARVAEFLPYDALLPRTSVVVSNGGFGGVQLSLAHGVPLVVAGTTEDKPEVAARVRWAGVGVDLRSGRPKPAAIRAGVRRVLADQRYAERARGLQRWMAEQGDPLDAIARTVEDLGADPLPAPRPAVPADRDGTVATLVE
ncbi:glycosyltransferase [Amnibacterium endophyticum]|uniref:Glycosyltransferase n=1 Tax=Amnibacterium endophyticum TaxID=2109337 RepID=A0ABW4LDH9_9MICO